MSTPEATPAVERLAQRLEDDIRSRGLRQGSRYLTTIEAGHLLGVSPATVEFQIVCILDSRQTNISNSTGRSDRVITVTVKLVFRDIELDHGFVRDFDARFVAFLVQLRLDGEAELPKHAGDRAVT